MGTSELNKYILIIGLFMLLLSCEKSNVCPNEGLVYSHKSSFAYYSPAVDSIPLGNSIVVSASVPRRFVDEDNSTIITNNSPTLVGPVHLKKLGNLIEQAADKFLVHANIGYSFKDTSQFTEGQLRGFRTVQWDGNNPDSFKIKLIFKPLDKGIYTIALGQQSYKDSDCALYKYFLKVGNPQHLYFITQYTNGYLSQYDQDYAYCFKVY